MALVAVGFQRFGTVAVAVELIAVAVELVAVAVELVAGGRGRHDGWGCRMLASRKSQVCSVNGSEAEISGVAAMETETEKTTMVVESKSHQ